MDILFAQIQADLRSSDALLQARQQSTAGHDISLITKTAVEEIVAQPASAVCKKLAFDLIRSTHLTVDLWVTACVGVRSDLQFPDPDVPAAAISILAAMPYYSLSKLITDSNAEISACFDSWSDNLRFSTTETLGAFWREMIRLLYVRTMLICLIRSHIHGKGLDRTCWTIKVEASGKMEVIKKLSNAKGANGTVMGSNAERFIGVSYVVTYLTPFSASSLDPALIFEVGISRLYLADVPAGKLEWASQSVIAILTLWDRQEFLSARESVVRAVVTNLHLLDLHKQLESPIQL
ncbi:hypothetical protein K2173_013886 [Erythroxylum novogranatense]|uniref:Uncharacterized protein n=1 Tax=Erythroxylum novogranatense TaxID=1862640 RepID=A0AAV8SD68_9ROSI|nr:hypothetical protein K2173_013886 [Erythroxylum novogranatense]